MRMQGRWTLAASLLSVDPGRGVVVRHMRRYDAVPPRVTVSDCSFVRKNHGMELSPLGVRATAGTLRASAGVVLYHQWTEEGVVASTVVKAFKCCTCRWRYAS